MTTAVHYGFEATNQTNEQNPYHGVQRRMFSVDNFYVFLRLLFFAVLLLYETCNLQFLGHHSYFKKDFQMLLTHKKGEI